MPLADRRNGALRLQQPGAVIFASAHRWTHNAGHPSSPSALQGNSMTQQTNQQEFDRASKVLVGGVNSAVRAFRASEGAETLTR